jgi:hypothetical protein
MARNPKTVLNGEKFQEMCLIASRSRNRLIRRSWVKVLLFYSVITYDSVSYHITAHRLLYCTRWFKYDRDKLWLVYTQIVPVIFEPPCIRCHHTSYRMPHNTVSFTLPHHTTWYRIPLHTKSVPNQNVALIVSSYVSDTTGHNRTSYGSNDPKC